MPEYVLGFRDLADRLGRDVVGEPQVDERTLKNPDGGSVITVQMTTRGLMVYMEGGQPMFIPGPDLTASRAMLQRPVHESYPVTAPFGYDPSYPVNGGYHLGIDYGCPDGSGVYAAAPGVVVWAGVGPETFTGVQPGAWGTYVQLYHPDTGLCTGYAHLSGYAVRSGERVEAAQLIGWSGNTGLSTGPHLHFQVIKDNVRVDPTPYIQEQ